MDGKHRLCDNDRSAPVAFWLLGLLNNTPYVIMLAAAKSISQGGTALVFIANIVPSLVIKLTSPYWFDRVSYRFRMIAASILMALSFSTVAVFSANHASDAARSQVRVMMQLWGVAMVSAQCGLGEASLLALGGKYDSRRPGKNQCLSKVSSGTGIAGVVGFFWKVMLVNWIGLSLKLTMWLANILAVAYAAIYFRHLCNDDDQFDHCEHESVALWTVDKISYQASESEASDADKEAGDHETLHGAGTDLAMQEVVPIEAMTLYQRFRLFLGLYRYMIPLVVVYAAEYSLQSGTWTAIGFPVQSLKARNQFYQYSNWMVSSQRQILFCWPLSSLTISTPVVPDWSVLFAVFWDVVRGSNVAIVVDAGSTVCQCRLLLVGCSRSRPSIQRFLVDPSLLCGSVGRCGVHTRLYSYLCRPVVESLSALQVWAKVWAPWLRMW